MTLHFLHLESGDVQHETDDKINTRLDEEEYVYSQTGLLTKTVGTDSKAIQSSQSPKPSSYNQEAVNIQGEYESDPNESKKYELMYASVAF